MASNLSNYFILNPCFKYKVVTDNCEHAFWEECEDQTKKVPFHVSETPFLQATLPFFHILFFFQTMESQCWKAKEIWYEKCREVSKPINMMCWSCVVKISSASKLVPNLFLPRSIVCPHFISSTFFYYSG